MIGYFSIDLQRAATLIGWFIIGVMNIQLCTLRHILMATISNRKLSVSFIYLSKQLWIITCEFSHCSGKRLLICLFVQFCLKSLTAYAYFNCCNYKARTVYTIMGHFATRIHEWDCIQFRTRWSIMTMDNRWSESAALFTALIDVIRSSFHHYQGLYLNFFSSVTTDFKISSALRWAIQDQGPLVYQIFFKFAGNKDRHKISDKFEFRPDWTTPYGIRCPWTSNNFPIDYNGKMVSPS